MFKKVLIANRGEIALRIMKTCREMGMKTVAVYSDADRAAAHVLEADQAVYLGPSDPSASYLNMEGIISAAKKSGAEAVHPGYGFLAENADFAAMCEAEGVVFIGPPAQAIRDLGDKTVARRMMIDSGVPVIPGMTDAVEDPTKMAAEAQKIGYPVLIKAAAGGGGKGMRVVQSPDELKAACDAASSEAAGAFGSGAIYLEKFIDKPRHVEFQVLADTHDNVIHLLERECSIQRRHQKIIEETPSPAMTDGLRDEMGAAAVAAARAAGYVNAGTVEFLLDTEGNFYFLEVNTRLQVEHPITEMVTGLDLVRLQLEIAADNPMVLKQQDVRGRGHAIECRIYAEDPENDFFPSPGKITFMKEPTGPGLRNDCGVYSGFTVPVEYDPILSKLVAHAETRDLAVKKMLRALGEYVILGIKTPIRFLMDVLDSEAFQTGETYTDFIPCHLPGWTCGQEDFETAMIAYIADDLCGVKAPDEQASGGGAVKTPFQTLGNWRP